ncbi:MAG TPA: AraC family transcriptional regulator, partial [Hyphomonas sp.]|nr:AraC family transcriptional regulator [Hyphomonas sp.]
MSKDQIRHLIDQRLPEAGVVDTALKGVQLFRVT